MPTCRPSLAELEARCQKLDHRRLGNWMARRVARPVALRVTWVVLPWGLSAHAVTASALLVACCAAAAFAWGGTAGWLIGAALLQLWYLLDHVDGQLARWHGTASLDGVALDYLMHHVVTLIIPLGIGYGLFSATWQPGWLLSGLCWGVGLLVLGLLHDVRYKAFVQRLKLVRGRLEVLGGGAARPQPQPPIPTPWRSRLVWLARKLCEPHVVMNLLTVAAAAQCMLGDTALVVAQAYTLMMAVLAPALAVAVLLRSLRGEAAEQEFALWYRPGSGNSLTYRDGWWIVEPPADR